jgi:hypothetical protein
MSPAARTAGKQGCQQQGCQQQGCQQQGCGQYLPRKQHLRETACSPASLFAIATLAVSYGCVAAPQLSNSKASCPRTSTPCHSPLPPLPCPLLPRMSHPPAATSSSDDAARHPGRRTPVLLLAGRCRQAGGPELGHGAECVTHASGSTPAHTAALRQRFADLSVSRRGLPARGARGQQFYTRRYKTARKACADGATQLRRHEPGKERGRRAGSEPARAHAARSERAARRWQHLARQLVRELGRQIRSLYTLHETTPTRRRYSCARSPPARTRRSIASREPNTPDPPGRPTTKASTTSGCRRTRASPWQSARAYRAALPPPRHRPAQGPARFPRHGDPEDLPRRRRHARRPLADRQRATGWQQNDVYVRE